MKKQVLSNVGLFLKHIIVSTVLGFMLMANAVSSHAQSVMENAETVVPIKVTYLGKFDLQPIFQIEIDNSKEDDLYLNLMDEDGGILYSDKFNNQRYAKKFRFDSYDAGRLKVTVSLTSKKFRKTQVLQFANEVRTVEDVVVTRVNY